MSLRKTILIKQPAGLGDILFCQKIADTLAVSHNAEIIWPVRKPYADLGEYLLNFSYPCVEDDFPFKDAYEQCPRHSRIVQPNFEVWCLDGCNTPNGVLKAKYDFTGMDWKGWQKHLKIKRKIDKEEDLFYNVLHLSDTDEYILVNDFIGSPPEHTFKVDLAPTGSPFKKVNLEFIEGFSLFDWAKVVEGATELYMEGSALAYIAEKLSLRATSLNLFSRDHHAIDGLFDQPWTSRYSNQTHMKDL